MEKQTSKNKIDKLQLAKNIEEFKSQLEGLESTIVSWILDDLEDIWEENDIDQMKEKVIKAKKYKKWIILKQFCRYKKDQKEKRLKMREVLEGNKWI